LSSGTLQEYPADPELEEAEEILTNSAAAIRSADRKRFIELLDLINNKQM
jgi:hypothetical protein